MEIDEKKIAYKCPFTGDLFVQEDPRLVGKGNPPHTPNAPVGTGRHRMEIVTISGKKYKAMLDEIQAKPDEQQYLERIDALEKTVKSLTAQLTKKKKEDG